MTPELRFIIGRTLCLRAFYYWGTHTGTMAVVDRIFKRTENLFLVLLKINHR